MQGQPEPVVVFPKSSTIRNTEAAFADAFAKADGPVEQLLLDMSDVGYIEITSLQHLTAIVVDRERKNLETKIRLPQGDSGLRVRHFLRRWGYPDAVASASGIPFAKLVIPEDLRYFKGRGGDPGDLYTQFVTYDLPAGKVNLRVEAHRFFGFTSWHIDKYADSGRLVHEASTDWNAEPIMAVLNRNLRAAVTSSPGTEPSLYIRSRLFFEAMTNAVRHPSATLIQTSSHLETGRTKKFFTIVFWDDGQSMVSTLKSSVAAGNEIRRPYPKEFDSRYLVVGDGDSQGSKERVVESTETPVADSTDEKVLLATLFPGVTRDVRGGGNFTHPETEKADPRMASPGMGLFVLIENAIGMFGGSVAFRTGEFFMNVRAANQTEKERHDVKYRAKILRSPDSTPPFLGNMVTIRLPLAS